jgi:hypothetical protein
MDDEFDSPLILSMGLNTQKAPFDLVFSRQRSRDGDEERIKKGSSLGFSLRAGRRSKARRIALLDKGM